mgnify:CR=1 FL=1
MAPMTHKNVYNLSLIWNWERFQISGIFLGMVMIARHGMTCTQFASCISDIRNILPTFMPLNMITEQST